MEENKNKEGGNGNKREKSREEKYRGVYRTLSKGGGSSIFPGGGGGGPEYPWNHNSPHSSLFTSLGEEGELCYPNRYLENFICRMILTEI